MITMAYSKALFSTWIYHSPIRTLFDAGEGVNIHMEGKLAAVRNILLTHGHTDHFAGLMNIFSTWLRNLTPEETEERRLSIFYPRGDRALIKYINFLRDYFGGDRSFRNDVDWVPVQAGDMLEMPSRRRTKIGVFPVRHAREVGAVGYHIIETRDKLRPEFENAPQQEINSAIVERGKDAVTYPADTTLISYVGDTRPMDPETFSGVVDLWHEATFLFEDERVEQTHSLLRESLETAARAGVESLLLYHFSSRYTRKLIDETIAELKADMGLEIPIRVLYPGRLKVWK